MEFLKQEFFSNTIEAYLIALIAFIGSLVVLKIFKTIVIAKIKKISQKTNTKVDDMIIDAINSIHWPFFVFVSFYFCLNFLTINQKFEKIFFYILLISFIYYSIHFLSKIIDYSIRTFSTKRGEKNNDSIMKLIGSVAKIALWASAAVLILANMGINVTSLVAGMGIGGIAIALALQNILGDLFSSLSIYFDKPFQTGDFVTIGNNSGNVKRVGLKTTRITTPQGEELVVANSELTKAQLSNFGAMKRRRITFSVGVAYETPIEKLKKITGWIREIIESHKEKTEVARIHFSSFGDSSLIFEITYYVNSGNYDDYMDMQEEINFGIIEKFQKENIEIAYPTQTLHIIK